MQAATVIQCHTNINPQSISPAPTSGNVAVTNPTNVLTVPVPVPVGQAAVARSRAVLPLQALHSSTSNFEHLPIAVVLGILWPYISDVPTMRAIEQAFRFGGSLDQWLAPIEERAALDVAAFRSDKRQHAQREAQEAWAVSFGANGKLRDYTHVGLVSYPGNRFWATQFHLPAIEGDNIDGRAAPAHRVDSLRIAVEIVINAMSGHAPLDDHRYLLAAVDELYEGKKGFANVQLAREKAQTLGLGSVVNFTRPWYSPHALNQIRMLILESAVKVVEPQLRRTAIATDSSSSSSSSSSSTSESGSSRRANQAWGRDGMSSDQYFR